MLGLGRTTGKAQVSKMETGHYRSGPGFVRLLDYLRACGYGIDSLLDILDRHTSQEAVPEEQASKGVLAAIATMPPQLGRRAFYYHIGLTHKARLRVRSAVAAAERVRQATARGRAEARELRLKRLFNDVLNELHIAWNHTYGIHLRSYGRLVFATLRRLRKAKPGWRERALVRLDEWPEKRCLDPVPFHRMKEAVMKLFEKLDRAGELEDEGRIITTRAPSHQGPTEGRSQKAECRRQKCRTELRIVGLVCPCLALVLLAALAFLAVQLDSEVRSMNRAEHEQGREELVSGLSSRFVELRRRAGMTQQGVADAMGKAKAGRRLAGRLERGAVASASLLTVAEYLRAVRAGFGDLKDVLDRYTSLPIPEPARKLAEAAPLPRVSAGCPNLECVQRRAAALPEKRELRSRNPLEEPDVQTLRVRRRAGYWVLRRVFEYYLHSGLHAAGVPAASGFRRSMATYGRRAFNALFRTRGNKEAKRLERLARLQDWAEKHHFDLTLAGYMELLASLAFEDMREHDELDWMPPPDEAYAIMSVKPKHRVVTDAQMCLAEWWEVFNRYSSATQEVYARAHKSATDVVAGARCDARTAFRYKLAATRATNIASFTAPDTKERRRSVADFNATDWPPEMDRNLLARVLAVALEVWDSSRPSLPPSPGPRPV